MSSSLRVCAVVLGSLVLPGAVVAGPVAGKLELPPAPERPPTATKGFLDRVENPLAPPRAMPVAPYMIVALVGGSKPTPAQVTWELVGESFARPVTAAAVGAEVVIKNVSRTSRTLVANEDPKLIPAGPINPTGPKSFRTTEEKVYTIGDKDAPHLQGTVVVVDGFVATVADGGKFEFAEVPEGSYKLRVFYKDAWLDATTEVVVGAKGKTEVTLKVPALTAAEKK